MDAKPSAGARPETDRYPPIPYREPTMFVQLTKDFLGKKAGERIDVHDADGQQMIQSGSAVAVPDDPLAPAVSRALEGALAKYSQNLDAAVNQALKAYADAQKQA